MDVNNGPLPGAVVFDCSGTLADGERLGSAALWHARPGRDCSVRQPPGVHVVRSLMELRTILAR